MSLWSDGSCNVGFKLALFTNNVTAFASSSQHRQIIIIMRPWLVVSHSIYVHNIVGNMTMIDSGS